LRRGGNGEKLERKAKSGIMLILLISMLTLAFDIQLVKASGTIYIRADGSIDPPTAPIQHSDVNAFSEPPAMEWNKTYGGSDKDFAYSLVQTSDEGYALAGETWSFGAGDIDFWLVKTDAYGNMQWSRTYGEISSEGANSVVQTSDGGYALAGWYGSETHGKQFRLIKTDSFGEPEWIRTLGDYGHDEGNSVIETSDGGLAVAGATSKFGYYDGYYYPDFWLVKFSSSGNIEWDKTYGYAAPKSDIAYSVVQTSDGGYALVGQEGVSADFWLVKTDAYGNMQWNKTIESPRGSEAYSVIQTSDGGYAITGDWIGEYGEYWARLVKTDSFGEVEWDWQYSDNPFHYSTVTYSVVQTGDGGYAIAGVSGYWRFWLIRTDTTGEPIYEVEYGPYYSCACSMVKTVDGGYAMAGSTSSFGAGDADFYLVKIAPELLQHDVTIIDVLPYETVVYQGDSLLIDVTAANPGDYTETFNVTLYANTTIIGLETLYLISGDYETITWIWDTIGFATGNYTISATASQVPGETDTANNIYIDGIVTILPIPYVVTIRAYCYTESTYVSVSITMDGIPTGYTTPYTFTGLTGTHTFTVPNTDANSHPFKQWSTGNTSTTITVSSGGTYIAYYQSAVHDVAVTNIVPSKTVVGKGYSLNINVTAANQGDYTETFNVTVYINTTAFTGFRKPITITERSGNTLTDYQVPVTVDTASLISAGKMRPDCGDIRFRDSIGSEIPYWIESGINTDNTRIWVKVPSIAALGSTTIYMYYGNPSLGSMSNGTATFCFFDDFNSLDTTQWTVSTSGNAQASVSNGELVLSAPQGIPWVSGGDVRVILKSVWQGSYIIGAKARRQSALGYVSHTGIIWRVNEVGGWWANEHWVYMDTYNNADKAQLEMSNNAGITIANLTTVPISSAETTIYIKRDYPAKNYYSVIDGTQQLGSLNEVTNGSWTILQNTNKVGMSANNVYSCPSFDFRYDWFLVSKYVSPEPTVQVGEEESVRAKIASQTVTLESGISTTITFTWNTAGFAKGNYTITAGATILPGETDTEDNNSTDGWVFITLPGDVNGDKTVNILDCILLANHFGHINGNGHTQNTEEWRKCMNCNINCDGNVNILDCIILAGHFGQRWP